LPNYLILNLQRYPLGEIIEEKVKFHRRLNLSTYKPNSHFKLEAVITTKGRYSDYQFKAY
jgi:hypothetical protein